jgi:hypothetical protein
MNYSLYKYWLFFSHVVFFLLVVLYPVNLDLNLIVKITPGEHNFDRSTFNIDALIEQLTLNIDSKQFSDLLDFAKFQNYSTLYGTLIHLSIHLFIYYFYFVLRAMSWISWITFTRIYWQ